MASTSTNKAPLLMDRPLLVIAKLDGTSTPPGSVDPGSGTNAKLLVDCTNNDGALIEAIGLIRRTTDTAPAVALYLSTSSLLVNSDALFLGAFAHQETDGEPGEIAFFPLLPLLAPVPHAGFGGPANADTPQFLGLRISRGLALWAACDVQTPATGAPNIIVQGGFH